MVALSSCLARTAENMKKLTSAIRLFQCKQLMGHLPHDDVHHTAAKAASWTRGLSLAPTRLGGLEVGTTSARVAYVSGFVHKTAGFC